MGWELRESTSLQLGIGAALETAAAPTPSGKHQPVTFSAFFGICSPNALNNLAVPHPIAVPQLPTHTWAPPHRTSGLRPLRSAAQSPRVPSAGSVTERSQEGRCAPHPSPELPSQRGRARMLRE